MSTGARAQARSTAEAARRLRQELEHRAALVAIRAALMVTQAADDRAVARLRARLLGERR